MLVALSTPDDAQRRSAEAALNRMKEADPGTVCCVLVCECVCYQHGAVDTATPSPHNVIGW